jgi:hypothetical protein
MIMVPVEEDIQEAAAEAQQLPQNDGNIDDHDNENDDHDNDHEDEEEDNKDEDKNDEDYTPLGDSEK